MRKDWMAWAYSQETVTSPTAMAVLLALAKHSDEAGFCFPSVERITGTTTQITKRVRSRRWSGGAETVRSHSLQSFGGYEW